MTVEELYDSIGANYAAVLRRIPIPSFLETLIIKFLDEPSCQQLIDAWAAGDEKAAFEGAHSTKGVCANLELTRLAQLSDTICEALREGNDDLRASTDVDSLVAEFTEVYGATIAAIRDYQQNR